MNQKSNSRLQQLRDMIKAPSASVTGGIKSPSENTPHVGSLNVNVTGKSPTDQVAKKSEASVRDIVAQLSDDRLDGVLIKTMFFEEDEIRVLWPTVEKKREAIINYFENVPDGVGIDDTAPTDDFSM
jgi:hypothetical protein